MLQVNSSPVTHSFSASSRATVGPDHRNTAVHREEPVTKAVLSVRCSLCHSPVLSPGQAVVVVVIKLGPWPRGRPAQCQCTAVTGIRPEGHVYRVTLRRRCSSYSSASCRSLSFSRPQKFQPSPPLSTYYRTPPTQCCSSCRIIVYRWAVPSTAPRNNNS